jgi:hypothetical protein
MSMTVLQDTPSDRYARLRLSAERALAGPLSIRVGTDFWGWANLVLRRETMPKIQGTVEVRGLYAHLKDLEQDNVLLREVTWDAALARSRSISDERDTETAQTEHPLVFMRCVWVDAKWLRDTLHRLEKFSVPLKLSDDATLYKEIYQFELERGDRTVFKFSWAKGMPGVFAEFSQLWESLWEEMTVFLRNNPAITPEEDWAGNPPPDYQAS